MRCESKVQASRARPDAVSSQIKKKNPAPGVSFWVGCSAKSHHQSRKHPRGGVCDTYTSTIAEVRITPFLQDEVGDGVCQGSFLGFLLSEFHKRLQGRIVGRLNRRFLCSPAT